MSARRIGLGLIVVALLASAWLFRGPLARAALSAIADVATGSRVSMVRLQIRSDHAVIWGLHIERRGDPLFDADRIDISYQLRDLLPGGQRRFGLVDFAVNHPQLTIVRHQDGSFNLSTGAARPGVPAGPGKTNSPLEFTGRIRDGSIVLIDTFRFFAPARKQRIDHISADIAVNSLTRTHYLVRGDFESGGAHPLQLVGTVDQGHGFAMQHLFARSVPLATLLNYAINSNAARLFGGIVNDVDVRAYALNVTPDRDIVYHLSGRGELRDGALLLGGFRAPLSNIHGRIEFFDGGLATRDVSATLADTPVHVTGGLYDFSDPKFRLFVSGAGALEHLRTAFAFSSAYPVRGNASIGGSIEGPVGDPLVLIHFLAPRPMYDRYPIDDAHGLIAYYRSGVDLVPGAGNYGGIAFTTRGHIELDDASTTRLAIESHAAAANVPYLAQIVPLAQLHGSAVIAGPAASLDARAIVDGAGGGDLITTLLHVDPHGDGAFAPLIARRADGSSMMGAFYLNRASSTSAFWLDAANYLFAQVAQPPHLPGLPDWAPPDFAGRVDGIVGGAGTPATFALAGVLRARHFEASGVPFSEVSAAFSGQPANVRLGAVHARGSWGDFDGEGGYAASRLAVRGVYRGSFEQLRLFTGDLGAHGPLSGPVALLAEPARTVVQAGRVRVHGVSVRGVPIDGFSGTLEIRNRALRVDGATVALAGGTLVAAGSLGSGHRIGVSATRMQASRLRAAGLPVQSGTLAAIGGFGFDDTPRFTGGVVVDNARYGGYAVAGNGNLDLHGANAQIGATEVLLGRTYGVLDGSIGGLGTSLPRYNARVAVRGADIGTLFALTGSNRWYAGGTLDADLHVGGAGLSPALQGNVRVPEGTVNGLRFHNGTARVDVNPAFANFQDGGVVVGSTPVAFAGGAVGEDMWARLAMAHGDLADFNDFFDAGDTLGGKGRVIFDFSKTASGARTSADIAVNALRYRRFPLGDTVAQWQTRGSNVDGSIAFGGASGRLAASGRVVLAHGGSLRSLFERSAYDVNASLRGLDLGVWLPTLGYQLPVSGRIDADGTIRGRYPALGLGGTASLVGGSIGKYPVNRLTISAVSSLERTTITDAVLELPSLTVRGAGSVPFAPREPLTLTMHASSSDVGAFATKILGRSIGLVGGALEAEVWITGSRAKPRIISGFDVEHGSLGSVIVPRIVGSLGIEGHNAVLRDAEISLKNGTLSLAGAIPFTVAPFGIGPGSAPVGLDLALRQIDLTAFQPLLPPGSQIGGILDGRMAIDGTAAAPRLRGTVNLNQGLIVTSFERTPLRNIAAKLDFGGSRVRLLTLHADAGPGTIDAGGSAVLADLVHPTVDTTYAITVRAAHAQLNLPAFGTGTVDGTLTVSHHPGDPPLIAGAVTATDAVIPFSALYQPDAGLALGSGGAGSDVAFNIDAVAGKNVRVRSANLDLGATGSVNVGGALSAPRLQGEFTSTGGTIGYFNRLFRVIDGTVTFERDLGIVPLLDARATAHVFDPTSFAGSTDITLTVTGPVTNLTIALDSDAGYDRQQILALLLNAPELGTLISNGTVARAGNGNSLVNQEAFSVINAQFSRALLAPLESAFGQALGLTNLNFDFDYTGGVNVTARKLLGKTLNAIYATNLTYPYRQSFGFEIRPNKYTSAQLTLYQTLGQNGLAQIATTNILTTTNRTLLLQPGTGTNGVSFSFLRYLP